MLTKVLEFGSEEAWKEAKWSDGSFSVDAKIAEEINNAVIVHSIVNEHDVLIKSRKSEYEKTELGERLASISLLHFPGYSPVVFTLDRIVSFYKELAMRSILKSAKEKYSVIQTLFPEYADLTLSLSGLVRGSNKINCGNFSLNSCIELAYFAGNGRVRLSLQPLEDAVVLGDAFRQDPFRPACQFTDDDAGLVCYLQPIDTAQKILDYLTQLAKPVETDLAMLKTMRENIATARNHGNDLLIKQRLGSEYATRLGVCISTLRSSVL